MKKLPLILLVVILIGAVGLQLVPDKAAAISVNRVALADVLPRRLAGWQVEEVAIAESAEMQRAVGELLNFDDGVCRRYRRGGVQFEVYSAYWRPGKMSHRLVAGHTPDVCWVSAGCRLLAQEERTLPVGSGASLGVGQYREFMMPQGARQYVVFWHRAGDRLVSYGASGTPPWWAVFHDLAEYGFNQKQAQYFVRIAANVPLAQLYGEPGFKAVMEAARSAGRG